MPGLELKAHAKVNLSLDVLAKREDGYHELRMIMQTVALHDSVLLEAAPAGIILECSSRWVPEDRSNTAWKAADLLRCKFGINSGIKIKIIKRIPVAAGLAGGSSDAAAVLRGVNELFSLGLSLNDLKLLGKQVGADVPYCINGGTMLAEGIGEKLTQLPDFSGVDIVLVKPRIGVSTAWVYGNLRTSEIIDGDRPDTNLLSDALKTRDIRTVAENMKNVLESVTIPKYDIVRIAKDKLLELGAFGSMMSGSGPTAFGIFPDGKSAGQACGILAGDKRWECFRTKTTAEIK
jgi:4-diphosphocytidyl-2-C-methyl-D-erythritol kinase